jgi:antitoxin component YwqK of YwqJK toxin-antitoxin module
MYNEILFNGEYKNGIFKEYYSNGKLKFDGVYFIGEKREGNLYIDGYLEYNDEFLNNKKWNGKGYDKNNNILYELVEGTENVNEYGSNGKISYEGEYLNQKMNGNVKIYYSNGNISFEGKYINGIRNGIGKTYYPFGELDFEGEYINGKKNGKGKEYHYNGKVSFEGEYKEGVKNGKGKEYDNEGNLIFEGE